ncbi:MAG: FG-GAP-like repeat-containing protein, partial [Chitinophagales bacterium]
MSLPAFAPAQIKIYLPDTTIKVFAYGYQQTIAWCGGFNNPQFSMGDLNHDGLQDLVVFEPWLGVKTFINKGTPGNPDYRYAPEYELNFPPIYDYLILADYNSDGIPDLFHQGSTGISAYKGYYNAQNQLCFTFYRDLFYYNDLNTHGPANAFNNPGDIPSIVDVDNDGDLDFISYNINGGYMEYYKNMRAELGLSFDSIHIDLKDNCWGKVYQGFYRTHYLAQTCDNSSLQRQAAGGERTTHSGNTPCLFDWDMDGDYDYLDGSVSFNQMTFLKNGRIPDNPTGVDSMISEDTMWQTGGTQINIPIWPAAYNIDIDQDGKKDLIIAPNGGAASKNYNNVWFYKNYTTPGVPDWRFQSDSFLVDKAIDLGKAAYPTLFDYNKDGKPDLFIGSDGYSQSSGLLRSRISYYMNTSTPGNTSFTLQTNDFLGINTYNFQGTAPAMGDIDNDGKADMIIGHSDGTLSYFKNMAASDTVQPVWQLMQLQLTDASSNTINVGDHAAPFIYDIDKDGKKDLVIGYGSGYLQYYRNVSTTPGTIMLQLVNLQLGHVKVDPLRNIDCYSTPFFGKIDTTGIDYLLVG